MIRSNKTCQNCGSLITKEYCPNCSQRNIDISIPFLIIIINWFKESFGWKSKFWISFYYILFNPSKLIEEYINGQRRKYLSPIRILAYLTLLSFFINQAINIFIIEITGKSGVYIPYTPKNILIWILSVPIFAFILKLVNSKKSFYYSEHFIVSIYYHILISFLLIVTQPILIFSDYTLFIINIKAIFFQELNANYTFNIQELIQSKLFILFLFTIIILPFVYLMKLELQIYKCSIYKSFKKCSLIYPVFLIFLFISYFIGNPSDSQINIDSTKQHISPYYF